MKMRLFYFFAFIPFYGMAQISITSGDMPQSGVQYKRAVVNPLTKINYDSSGADFSLDFSLLVPDSIITDTFGSVNDLSSIFQFAFFGSNLTQFLVDSIGYSGVYLTDVYTIYKNAANAFEATGSAAFLDGIPVPLIYSPVDVIYNFPLQFGNSDTSNSAFSLTVPTLGYLQQNSTRMNYVDGWGTLKTPVGNYNVIRVKSVINTVDSIYVNQLGFGFSFPSMTTEYKWLANGSGLPVFQVNTTTAIGQEAVTSIQYAAGSTTGISSNEIKNDFTVYPSLVNQTVFIQSKSNTSQNLARLFSLDGKQWLTEKFNQSVRLDVSAMKSGMYFLQIQSQKNSESIPIIIQHQK